MSDVTEADRAKAMQVMAWEPLDYETFANAVNNGHHPDDRDALETVDAIAAALAAEREKARAPFLTVADEIHARGTAEVMAMDDEPDEHRKNQHASAAATYARAEHLIRRAAEES